MKKLRMLAALCAVFLLVISFSAVAYAGGFDEPAEETAAPAAETPAPVTESAVSTGAETNPFTPAGTGTVVDNATDGDGKEFYTIITANENVFFLIIDHQRETDNVYFLNAVTEKDLLALAVTEEADGGESVSAIPETPVTPEPTPASELTPEPESVPETRSGGGMGNIILIVVVILVGGGAGYYFKIYRPKQQQAEAEDDFDYSADESNPYGDDDGPPWDARARAPGTVTNEIYRQPV